MAAGATAAPNHVAVLSSGEASERCTKLAHEKGVKQVVFDRGGFQYQGTIKAFADAARAAGLEF